jgi:hypothetical protein
MKFPVPKFQLGDTVAVITASWCSRKIDCVTCEGKGSVTIHDEPFVCPRCKGAKILDSNSGVKHTVYSVGEIGKITVEVVGGRFLNPRSKEPRIEIKYMLDSTGVGSGSCWDEGVVFSSRSAAQAACDRLNAQVVKDQK